MQNISYSMFEVAVLMVISAMFDKLSMELYNERKYENENYGIQSFTYFEIILMIILALCQLFSNRVAA